MSRTIVCFGLLFALSIETPTASACLWRLRSRTFAPLPADTAPASGPVTRMPYADEGIKLQWKFAKGKDFYVETRSQTFQKMKVMGQDVTQTQDQTFVMLWQPIRKTTDGDWIIRVRIVRFHLKIEIGGNKIEFDSDDKTPRSPTGGFFEELVKADLKATVRADGGIRDIDGVDELAKTIRADAPGMQGILKSMVTKGSIEKMIAPLGLYLPAEPVVPNEKWTHTDTLDLGSIGRYATTRAYSYRGSVGQHHEIQSNASLKYTPPDAADPGLPFAIKSAELESTASDGKIIFDADAGRLREAFLAMRIKGHLRIEVGGQESQIELTQTQNMRVRTMDTFPPLKQ